MAFFSPSYDGMGKSLYLDRIRATLPRRLFKSTIHTVRLKNVLPHLDVSWQP